MWEVQCECLLLFFISYVTCCFLLLQFLTMMVSQSILHSLVLFLTIDTVILHETWNVNLFLHFRSVFLQCFKICVRISLNLRTSFRIKMPSNDSYFLFFLLVCHLTFVFVLFFHCCQYISLSLKETHTVTELGLISSVIITYSLLSLLFSFTKCFGICCLLRVLNGELCHKYQSRNKMKAPKTTFFWDLWNSSYFWINCDKTK